MVFPNCDIVLIKKVFKTIFQLLKKNGSLFTVNYLKQCRLLITRYICGRPIRNNKHYIGTKGGFPLKFYYLKPLIDSGNINKIKFVLTLMNISRTISPKRGEKVPINFKSIIEPNTKKYKTISGSFILQFIKDYNLTFKLPQYTTNDFFMSLKQGPHGPSILSIMETIK